MLEEQTTVTEDVTEDVEEQASQETSEQTSKQKEVTLADIQASELFRKTQAERDRFRANLENIQKQSQEQITHYENLVKEMRAERRKAALGEFGDDPKVHGLLRDLEQAEELLANAKREKELLKTQSLEVAAAQKEVDAYKIARQYEVPIEDLMECESFSEMERIAKVLSKTKTNKVEQKVVKQPPKLDSGLSSGGGKGRVFKVSEINNMSSDERFKLRSDIAKAQMEGRILNE